MASVVAAVEQAIKHNAGTLTINTDSQYLINYSKMIETWKKKTNNQPLKDVEDIKQLDRLCSKHTIKWVSLSFIIVFFGFLQVNNSAEFNTSRISNIEITDRFVKKRTEFDRFIPN